MSSDDGFLPNEIFEIVLENSPLVSVDLILENEKNQFLLGRRRNQPAKGFWFVPGGRIRKGELIIDALKRVALEEVGLIIKDHNSSFLGAFDHIYENSIFSTEARPSSTHYVALGFHYQIRAEEVSQVEKPQHSELSWMSLKTASSIDSLHKLSHDYILALSQGFHDASKNGNT